jgi:3-phenylpropionate/cinnamic acid dioxygenase small subunit
MLSTDDRLAIHELLALHGHVMDDGAFDRLEELFSEDFVYDLTALGRGQLRGRAEFVRSAVALGDENPLAHHVTNVLITAVDSEQAKVHSKGLAVRADGTSGSVVYEDRVERTAAGWRITHRAVIPRNRPLRSGRARAV